IGVQYGPEDIAISLARLTAVRAQVVGQSLALGCRGVARQSRQVELLDVLRRRVARAAELVEQFRAAGGFRRIHQAQRLGNACLVLGWVGAVIRLEETYELSTPVAWSSSRLVVGLVLALASLLALLIGGGTRDGY